MNSDDRVQWMKAERIEFEQLRDQGVFEVVVAPEGSQIIPSKFVYKKKFCSMGDFQKYKARLTACNTGAFVDEAQEEEDRYAPTVRMDTLI